MNGYDSLIIGSGSCFSRNNRGFTIVVTMITNQGQLTCEALVNRATIHKSFTTEGICGVGVGWGISSLPNVLFRCFYS